MKRNSINKTNFSSVLQKYIEYNVCVNFSEDFVFFTICFPDNFNVDLTDDREFDFIVKEDIEVKNKYYFGIPIDNDYTNLFGKIDEIIDENINHFKKIELFKQKSDELYYLFNNASYEELKNITFVYGSDVKPKRKYIRKNSTAEAQTPQQDEVVNEQQVGSEEVQNEVTENDTLQVQVVDKDTTINEEDAINKI